MTPGRSVDSSCPFSSPWQGRPGTSWTTNAAKGRSASFSSCCRHPCCLPGWNIPDDCATLLQNSFRPGRADLRRTRRPRTRRCSSSSLRSAGNVLTELCFVIGCSNDRTGTKDARTSQQELASQTAGSKTLTQNNNVNDFADAALSTTLVAAMGWVFLLVSDCLRRVPPTWRRGIC